MDRKKEWNEAEFLEKDNNVEGGSYEKNKEKGEQKQREYNYTKEVLLSCMKKSRDCRKQVERTF